MKSDIFVIFDGSTPEEEYLNLVYKFISWHLMMGMYLGNKHSYIISYRSHKKKFNVSLTNYIIFYSCTATVIKDTDTYTTEAAL